MPLVADFDEESIGFVEAVVDDYGGRIDGQKMNKVKVVDYVIYKDLEHRCEMKEMSQVITSRIRLVSKFN